MNKASTKQNTTSKTIGLSEGSLKQIKAMSIDELRNSEHYSNSTDEELISMIETMRAFTEIVYSAWSKREQRSEQNTIIIPLHHIQRRAA